MLIHRRPSAYHRAAPWLGMMTRVPRIALSVLAILSLVLIILGCQPREFTLVVLGEDDADGAGVFVNGRSVGTMAKEGAQRPQFTMTFPKGTVTVEVKKDGYLPFLEVITITSQVSEQVHVTLARDTISEEKRPDAATDPSRRPAASPAGKLPVCPD